MTTPSLGQARKLIEAVDAANLSGEQTQALLESGLFTLLCEAAKSGKPLRDLLQGVRTALGLAVSRAAEFFELVVSGSAPAVAKCSVGQCFVGAGFAYRDPDFDNWLSRYKMGAVTAGASTVSTHRILRSDLTLVEMVALRLGMEGSSEAEIAARLVKEKKGFSSTMQIHQLLVDCDKGVNPLGLNGAVGGWNLFLLVVGGQCFWVDAFRDSGGWFVYGYLFVNGDRCDVGYLLCF